MIAILYISSPSDDSPLYKEMLREPHLQVILRRDAATGAALLKSGWFELCILDPHRADPAAGDKIRQLRSACPATALLVVSRGEDRDWERSMMEQGADYLLDASLPWEVARRLLTRWGCPPERHAPSPRESVPRGTPAAPSTPPFPAALSRQSALTLFRDVSRALSVTGDFRRMVEQFLLQLRDLTGVPQLSVFLERPHPAGLAGERLAEGRLYCEAAFGIPGELRQCLVLSRQSGLGRLMREHPSVVFLEDLGEGNEHGQMRKEIAVAGGVMALPINDREGNLGVAVMGDRVTGALQEEDLALLVLLLEELGGAIRHSWIQMENREHQQLLEKMFASMHCGCMVLDGDGRTLQINYAFRQLMAHRGFEVETPGEDRLPELLRQKIVEARSGSGDKLILAFIDEDLPEVTFQATLIPLGLPLAPPHPLFLILEDRTPFEREKAEEIASSREELAGVIAKRFAHEIRNSLVPLVTHLHLFEERKAEPGFQESLRQSLAAETGRIARFSDQMLYFSPRNRWEPQPLNLLDIIRETGREIIEEWGDSIMEISAPGKECIDGIWLEAEAKALQHAFRELFLNSMQGQGNPSLPKVRIQVLDRDDVEVHILDQGPGIDPAKREAVFEPFFTMRTTGIGMGLAVARKILEDHHGTIFIQDAPAPYRTDFTLILPYTRIECQSISTPSYT